MTESHPCDRCGFQNRAGALRCEACGNVLVSPPEPPATATEPLAPIAAPTEAIAPPPAPLPASPPTPAAAGPPVRVPRTERWPAIRRFVLALELLGAMTFGVLAIVDGRYGFLWTAVAFAAVPLGYAAALIVGGERRGTGLVVAGVLVPVLGASVFAVVSSCDNRLRPGADLSGCDFAGADLGGFDLAGANLSEANLAAADLGGADLSDARLENADLGDAELRRANLRGANLAGADLRDADLDGAELAGVDLRGADLRGLDLSGVDLSGLTMSRADLTGTNLSQAFLTGARLDEATLADADLSDAQAEDADLDGAVLDGADLRGVVLAGATLVGATLRQTNLEAANLSGADLEDAELTGAVLDGAALIGTQGVSDAELAGVLGVPEDELGGVTIERDIRLERRDAILTALGPACGGRGVGDAAPFAGKAPHPMVVLGARGDEIDASGRATELGWEPTALRFAQLVACVGEEREITVELCQYVTTGGGLGRPTRRVRFTRDVRVVVARTGNVVFRQTYDGGFPNECPFQKTTFGTSGEDRIEGGRVGFDRFRRKLSDLVR